MHIKSVMFLIGLMLIVIVASACEESNNVEGDETVHDEAQVPGKDDGVTQPPSADEQYDGPPVAAEKEPWANSELAKLGYLDVTLLGADPTGQKDSTKALQSAIDTAYKHAMVVFFPEGTYLVSDTLRMDRYNENHIDQFRTRKGHVLVGSTKGERPMIKLTDNNPLFQDASREETTKDNPTTTRAVIHFWTDNSLTEALPEEELGQFDFNQVFRGINIDLGEGNPGAVGIRHRGAEGTSTEDVTIFARDGFAGIYGLLGSGGGQTNIEIYGGKYGIYVKNNAQPMPVITGAKLIGQRDYAIHYFGLTPMALVGFEVEKEEGPVFYSGKWPGAVESWGNIALYDGKVEVKNGGAETVLIENSDRMLYIQNVYTKNVGKISMNKYDGTSASISNPAVWSRIDEYAYSKNFDDTKSNPKLIDMVSTNVTQVKAEVDSETPPDDLISRHIWDENVWTAEHEDVINVMDFGATGDGITDDTAAIQAAIDAADATGKNRVLLPKGQYRVSDTIYLREHSKLFGVARHLSELNPMGWTADKNTPIIQSADSKTSTNVIANFKIDLHGTRYNIYGIDWKAGRHSIAKDVWICWDFDSSRSNNVQQWVRITGNGGGRWYNHTTEIGANTHALGYRGVLIEGTTEPLTFYQFHNQHIKSDAISEVRHAANVTFYGVKTETQTTGGGEHRNNPDGPWPRSLIISGSNNVQIHGYSGMGQTKTGQGLIEMTDSTNVIVTNMGRWSENMHPLDQWYYILLTQNGVPAGITADTTVNVVKISAKDAVDKTAPVWEHASLSASKNSANEVTLSWSHASDETGVVSYEIYKDGLLQHTVTNNDTTAVMTDLEAGKQYQFKIEAKDAAGNVSTDGPAVTVATSQ